MSWEIEPWEPLAPGMAGVVTPWSWALKQHQAACAAAVLAACRTACCWSVWVALGCVCPSQLNGSEPTGR